MIFCWGSTTSKLLQQAVKYSGCSSFVGVKYDNPIDSDDDSDVRDINAMVATMIIYSKPSRNMNYDGPLWFMCICLLSMNVQKASISRRILRARDKLPARRHTLLLHRWQGPDAIPPRPSQHRRNTNYLSWAYLSRARRSKWKNKIARAPSFLDP